MDFTVFDQEIHELHEATASTYQNIKEPRRAQHATLPPGLAYVFKDRTEQEVRGVLATCTIQKGEVFGPFRGTLLEEYEGKDISTTWELSVQGHVRFYTYGGHKSSDNWMISVNSANTKEEQNLEAFQFYGEIFYRSFNTIQPGTELKVFYCDKYRTKVGFRARLEDLVFDSAASHFKCQKCKHTSSDSKLMLRHMKFTTCHLERSLTDSETPITSINNVKELNNKTRSTLSQKTLTNGRDALWFSPYSVNPTQTSADGESSFEMHVRFDRKRNSDAVAREAATATALMEGNSSIASSFDMPAAINDHRGEGGKNEQARVETSKGGGEDYHHEEKGKENEKANDGGDDDDGDADVDFDDDLHGDEGRGKNNCDVGDNNEGWVYDVTIKEEVEEDDSCEPSAISSASSSVFLPILHENDVSLASTSLTPTSSDAVSTISFGEPLANNEQMGNTDHNNFLSAGPAERKNKAFYTDQSGNYVCPTCDKSFQTEGRLINHKRFHWSMQQFVCDICSLTCPSHLDLIQHKETHQNGTPHCQFCLKTYSMHHNLRRHLDEVHHYDCKSAMFVCKGCKQSYKEEKYLQVHLERCDRVRKKWMRRQTFKLQNPNYDEDDQKQKHDRNESSPIAGLEDLAVTSELIAKEDTEGVHTDDEIQVISIPREDITENQELSNSGQTSQRDMLGVRLNQQANTGNYICKHCKRSFAMKSTLLSHIWRVHSTHKEQRCNICHKAFRTAYLLKRHMRVHSTEHRFKCKLCTRSFASEKACASHQLDHSDERPFKCETCVKGFRRRELLNQHNRRLHFNLEKQFSCSFCGKKFFEKVNCNRHEQRHLGIRPFVCETCQKAFPSKYVLQQHMLTHSSEKPLQCHICQKRFRLNHHLDEHLYSHSLKKF